MRGPLGQARRRGFVGRIGQHNGPQALGPLGQNALAHGKPERLGQVVVQRVIQPTKQQHVSEHLRMFKRAIHHHRARDASTQTEAAIARELFACAAAAGNSEHKRAHFIGLPALVLELVRQGQAAGDLNRKQDADAAAMLFVGIVQGLVLRWEIAGRDHPLAARFEPVFLVWLHGAGPKRADRECVEAEPIDDSVQTARINEAGKSVPLAMLDVRPLIARGVDPLSAILTKLEELPSTGALVVQAPFRPSPLLSLLSRRGHGVSAEALSETHWAVEVVVGGALTIDDLRDFEPPEPMERVLSAVALLAPGGAYLARLPRHPELLLPKLLERGLMVQVAPRGDGSTLLRVEKRA